MIDESVGRHYIMSQIKSVSKIERVPLSLKELNLRHSPDGIFGRPDFANKRRKIALFIDGCFWHNCPRHKSIPKTNARFWENKLFNNYLRDRRVDDRLSDEGWVVIRIYECALRQME
jgi:DNA mismatch endonuclease (patch repair protein)